MNVDNRHDVRGCDWRIWAGLALGVGAALALASVPRPDNAEYTFGPLLSDCDGYLRELVIQYTTGAEPVMGNALRQFLASMRPDIVVHVVTPNAVQTDDFKRRIATGAQCRFRYVETGCDITAWSRDRWVACLPGKGGGGTVLVAPGSEQGAGLWPARRGDSLVADAIAGTSDGRIRSIHHRLEFDGGDFVADEETVFVSPQVIRRNVGRTVNDMSELTRQIAGFTGKKVVMMKAGPFHHAGMFMMTAGRRRVIVGDPSLAGRVMREAGEVAPVGLTVDFTTDTQSTFGAVAQASTNAGYEVLRIPLVPSTDGRVYLSYVNVIQDVGADGVRRVYMPTYRANPALNRAASDVWQNAGYEVVPIDCTDVFPFNGSLRCLVNIAVRGQYSTE